MHIYALWHLLLQHCALLVWVTVVCNDMAAQEKPKAALSPVQSHGRSPFIAEHQRVLGPSLAEANSPRCVRWAAAHSGSHRKCHVWSQGGGGRGSETFLDVCVFFALPSILFGWEDAGHAAYLHGEIPKKGTSVDRQDWHSQCTGLSNWCFLCMSADGFQYFSNRLYALNFNLRSFTLLMGFIDLPVVLRLS